MMRPFLILLLLLATTGLACGEECADLNARECKERRDCAQARIRVQNAGGSHDKVACVDIGKE